MRESALGRSSPAVSVCRACCGMPCCAGLAHGLVEAWNRVLYRSLRGFSVPLNRMEE